MESRDAITQRISFCRKRTTSSVDKVDFEQFGKLAELSIGPLVAVQLLPKEVGEFAITCALGMFRGRVIVEWGTT